MKHLIWETEEAFASGSGSDVALKVKPAFARIDSGKRDSTFTASGGRLCGAIPYLCTGEGWLYQGAWTNWLVRARQRSQGPG